jgi:hypothetical protein
MRFVDIECLTLPLDWQAKADAAAAAVAQGASPDDYSQVWRDLKDNLAALLPDKKCWYCETQVDRADNAVDHFRPKGRVAEATNPHSGYRWLAFEPSNFRYSCTFCNSKRKGIGGGAGGGKTDRFPLVDEAARVYGQGDPDLEQPMLLDPCEFDDWELLGCMRENGKACPTRQDPLERRRVDASIGIFHLDYEPTVKRRHRTAVQFLSDVEQAKMLFLSADTDPGRFKPLFKTSAKRIRRAIERTSDFSGEMIFLLRGQRHSDHPWIQRLLEL